MRGRFATRFVKNSAALGRFRSTPETRIDLNRPDGATQLMMQSIIANKLKQCRPDILVRPAVSKYRVLDFLKIDVLMNETADIKDELKRQVEKVLETRAGAAVKARRGKQVG